LLASGTAAPSWLSFSPQRSPLRTDFAYSFFSRLHRPPSARLPAIRGRSFAASPFGLHLFFLLLIFNLSFDQSANALGPLPAPSHRFDVRSPGRPDLAPPCSRAARSHSPLGLHLIFCAAHARPSRFRSDLSQQTTDPALFVYSTAAPEDILTSLPSAGDVSPSLSPLPFFGDSHGTFFVQVSSFCFRVYPVRWCPHRTGRFAVSRAGVDGITFSPHALLRNSEAFFCTVLLVSVFLLRPFHQDRVSLTGSLVRLSFQNSSQESVDVFPSSCGRGLGNVVSLSLIFPVLFFAWTLFLFNHQSLLSLPGLILFLSLISLLLSFTRGQGSFLTVSLYVQSLVSAPRRSAVILPAL